MFFKNLRREARYEKAAKTMLLMGELTDLINIVDNKFPSLELMPYEVQARYLEAHKALRRLQEELSGIASQLYKLGENDEMIDKVMRSKGLGEIMDKM